MYGVVKVVDNHTDENHLDGEDAEKRKRCGLWRGPVGSHDIWCCGLLNGPLIC